MYICHTSLKESKNFVAMGKREKLSQIRLKYRLHVTGCKLFSACLALIRINLIGCLYQPHQLLHFKLVNERSRVRSFVWTSAQLLEVYSWFLEKKCVYTGWVPQRGTYPHEEYLSWLRSCPNLSSISVSPHTNTNTIPSRRRDYFTVVSDHLTVGNRAS